MKFLKIFLALASFLSHIILLTVIYFAIQPVANWYLSKIPIVGVDFYNSVTYATALFKNLTLPVNSFVDSWWAGYPLYKVFTSLHWFAMIPFVEFLGMVKGVQLYVIVALYLLVVSCYLFYFQLTKSRVLSVLVAFFVLFSVNIYGAAIWGGSLPFFATQFFLPLILLLVDKFITTNENRWLMAAILIAGIGFMSHPMPIFLFAFPCVTFLLFFGLRSKDRKILANIFWRIKYIFIFALGSLLVSLPASHERLLFTLNSFIRGGWTVFFAFVTPPATDVSQGAPAANQSQIVSDISKFYHGLVRNLYTDTNIWLFLLFLVGTVLLIVTVIFVRKKAPILRVLPYVLIAGFVILHTVLNAYGFNFLPQGWYREFWAFPIVLGALVAVMWGQFFGLIREKLRFDNLPLRFTFANLPFLVLAIIFSMIGYLFFTTKVDAVIATLDTKSEISSAHPQALSIRTSEEDLEDLKATLLPDFVDPNDKNKRLYNADALVNIWWSSFYDLPLVKGYIDPPLGTSQRGGFFWVDIALGNDSIVRDFKVDEETAFNDALFLIDWYGIYYYEGGRFGVEASVPPSSYLLKNGVFETEATTETRGALIKWQTPSGKPELNLDIPQFLRFFKVKDELTSPILYASNAPAILVFSDEPGYENFTRAIGATNLNSRYLIPVNAGRYIDDLKTSDFEHFDAVVLSNYAYHNKKKAFDLLSKFAQAGGKIFIDTGAESRESTGEKLPELLPIKSASRGGYGREWEFEVVEDAITEGVNFENFGPPIFGESEWKISTTREEVRDGAKVLLKHKGLPILANYPLGSGNIIWSGMNLLYHINQYHSRDESLLFANIIKQLVKIEKHELVNSQVKWHKPEKVAIQSEAGARGVLFKEQSYPGWRAQLIADDGRRLPIFRTGPTYPGFMYVPLSANEAFKLEFSYGGELFAYLIYGTSAILILLLLDSVLTDGFLLVKRIHIFKNLTDKKISTWWEKEDE